ncbi:hypothetical protein COLO4_09567 [Corchorus olitorius]|uniref:Uncharacterized protein n=1 Tax=Corchorus olitorius TaxID=93759 RepID=A0A1R3KBU1_9ROSI|nr:hypothetical protein COLO4_09567 [Corchorus olitorius]
MASPPTNKTPSPSSPSTLTPPSSSLSSAPYPAEAPSNDPHPIQPASTAMASTSNQNLPLTLDYPIILDNPMSLLL